MDATARIDEQIAQLGDWRGELCARLRALIHEAIPEIREEFKWGTGVFALDRNVCSIGAFKDHVKLNFFDGVALDDPHGLFNAGLDAKRTRAVDMHEGASIDESALRDLIQAAARQASRPSR